MIFLFIYLYICIMLQFKLNRILEKYSFGLRARLSILFIDCSRLTFGVLRPANFNPDYIEVKQKVGGNLSRLSMLQIPLIFCAKTPALFYANNGDLTSILLKLENYVLVGSTYTYEIYVRGNIEFKQQVKQKLFLN